MKTDQRMSRNHLSGSAGDATSAVLAAVGANFARLIAWMRMLLCAVVLALRATRSSRNPSWRMPQA
jgi:IS5 family transposase